MASTDSPTLSFLPTPAVTGPENAPPGCQATEQRSAAITRPGQSDKPFHSRSTTDSSAIGATSLLTSPSRQRSIDPVTGQKVCSNDAGSPILYPASFIDQSRALLDQQRRHFDQERGLFDQERAMWDMERKALYGRIEELERAVEESHHSRRMTSGGRERKALSFSHPRSVSEEMGESMVKRSSMPESGDRFWEGSSTRQGIIPTRVFTSPKSVPTTKILPTISERQNSTNDDGKEAPTLRKGIDISLIQHDLDGITLKTSAVPASILSKITSPISSSRKDHSKGHLSILESDDDDSNSNLTKNAGHTPKHLPIDLPRSAEVGSSALATPTQTKHLHRPSLAATSEVSRTTTKPSDLDLANLDKDPALHSPLTLPNAIVSPADSKFLEELDSRLLQESRKALYSPSTLSSTSAGPSTNLDAVGGGGGKKKNDDVEVDDIVETPEPEIKLRFKKSLNFGSAFGSARLGTY